MTASVVGVHRSGTHTFSKPAAEQIDLIEGIGVAGDAHAGTTVQHVSRVRKTPSMPNLRQVHLLHVELFDMLADAGFEVGPGQMGENITTRGLDVLGLPVGTRLTIGEAVITVTGLRNPCHQINGLRPGLMKQVLRTRDDGEVERLAGIMGVVSRGGSVRAGDEIAVALPPGAHRKLAPV